VPLYSVATSKTTGAAAGLIAEVRTSSTRDARVFEIGVTAETAVAGTIGLVRATNAGTTPGGAVVPTADDPNAAATGVNLYTTYGTEPTQAAVYLRRFAASAAIGAGVVWTFPRGLVIGTTGGLLIRQLSTAAVTYSVYVNFDE
jgi:hypothetical protein